MSKYVISAGAKADLSEIWEYIAQDNLDAADRWIGRLRKAVELVARSPGLGHSRPDLTDLPVLFWPAGAYLVLYLREGQTPRNCRDHSGIARYPSVSASARTMKITADLKSA